MDQSFCPKNSTEIYPKSTSTRNFEEIKTTLLSQSLDVQNSFFSFFRFDVFVNNNKTVIARILFLENIGKYFNSLSNATHPTQIHRAVLEKLRFKKMVKQILTSNIYEIYGSILLPKELS